jgi:hypothetical protein
MNGPTPRIIYLDQNQWIELARAEKNPSERPQQFAVLKSLRARRDAGEIVLPLASTNIYETYKIADPQRRSTLALLQASLSGGLVFRGRHLRLEIELSAFLAANYHFDRPPLPQWWFLSDLFYEAFVETDDERAQLKISDRLVDLIRQHPATALYDHLTTASNDERLLAVKRWSDGSEALRSRIESRRGRHQNESLAMRRRIYNVLMFSGEIELLARLAGKYGVSWQSMNDIGSALARRLVNEMPIYNTERELVLRLEAQSRPINENDFRDVHAYCAAIPYADEVIGENHLINLTRQAGLGEKYSTRLETDILALSP